MQETNATEILSEKPYILTNGSVDIRIKVLGSGSCHWIGKNLTLNTAKVKVFSAISAKNPAQLINY